MRTRLLIPFAILAALGAIAVTGCGGGGDSSSTTSGTSGATGASGTALTADEFAKQGNAICAAGNKELDQAANDTFTGGKPTDAQLQQYVTDTFVPSVQGQIDAVGALVPPADIADQVDTFLSDAQDALDQVENDPSLVAGSSSNGPFADVNKEAVAVGLDQCAG
ncbi:MAG: hypothetical protein QOI10_1155 [Solirubrobacterales bacterium]|jgi:hypothetical protein|nr:hypothetical protein [Solirubrobacterales bacterium]